MIQLGLFDVFSAYACLDKCIDPLMKLNEIIVKFFKEIVSVPKAEAVPHFVKEARR